MVHWTQSKFSSTYLPILVLLILSLSHTSIGYSQWYDDILSGLDVAGEHVGDFLACTMGGFTTNPESPYYPACNRIFPFNLETCTDSQGQSVDEFYCSDNALLNWIGEGLSTGYFTAQCNTAVQSFINTNSACAPVIKAATPQVYLDELTQLQQPLIDNVCILAQLQAASDADQNIFLPGCDPTDLSCQDPSNTDPNANPYYYMATFILSSYLAGYVFHYPSPAIGYGITNYIYDWNIAQTKAQQGTDQQGNPIIPQINVFDPNSFLNASNNTNSQVNGDLQLALQHLNNLLNVADNLFPGADDINLAKLNHKAITTCNPNDLCPIGSSTCIPCCNAPAISLPDAQANIMNTLNTKMNAIYAKQQSDSTILDYFATYTIFTPLDPTLIPPAAQVAPVAFISTSSLVMANNLPQPTNVGKVVTNWDPKYLSLPVLQEYWTQATLTDQILLTATDVNGNTVSCSPGSLMALYQNTMSTCELSAEQIAPFDAAVTTLASLAIFGVAFAIGGAMADALADSTIGPLISTFGKALNVLIKLYSFNLNIVMLINFSTNGATWFKTLPPAAQDILSPPLNIIVPANLKILEHQLECLLNENLLEYNPSSSDAQAAAIQACRHNAAQA